jgi:hypothetical protein
MQTSASVEKHERASVIDLEDMPSTTGRPKSVVTGRDVKILRGLFESRVMGLSHVAALYFEGRQEAAKKRVQKLKMARLIAERPRQLYEHSVLFLARKGIEMLSAAGALGDYPQLPWSKLEKRARVSPLTLRHELDCMDVKAALAVAIASTPDLSLTEFSTWPLLFQFPAYTPRGTRVLVKPDGFIRIAETDGESVFFLEVDRSTESQDILAERAACYLDYYRRGGLAVRFGYAKEQYKELPFRVLMTFRNAERRNNAAERLLANRPPILTQTILTTIDEFKADPLGPIWLQPIDYRKAVTNTPFDVDRNVAAEPYRRQPEREALVNERTPKQRLLGI